ncbi:dienelactone hydrolase family protein [Ensifer sp. PDNC004]|uniref:dienelactone hydrolase family protein n=1 Tax=Ensifer sp. PDNC004 TaxID=2811423 RepID=UPI001FF05CB9|nr:dienelactone hydrolase family protein [Ensifer sp. PDNC004]
MGALRPDIGPAVEAALRSVAAHPRLSGKVALVGMAFGGFLALRAAASVPTLAGVVSINGFFDLGGFWDALPQVYRDNMRSSLGGADVRERADRFTLARCHPGPHPSRRTRQDLPTLRGAKMRGYLRARRRTAHLRGWQPRLQQYPLALSPACRRLGGGAIGRATAKGGVTRPAT